MPTRSSCRPLKRPTADELRAAARRTLDDVLAPQLRVLFVGINPSLYSAAVGHHFARPGNRFWPTLAGAGFTPRLLSPSEDRSLPQFGCGLTNVAPRPTARADQLTSAEIRHGVRALARKVEQRRIDVVAILGMTVYRQAFQVPAAQVGPQDEQLKGARLWVLPNPSGLNAHYQLPDLIELFRALRKEVFGTELPRDRRSGNYSRRPE